MVFSQAFCLVFKSIFYLFWKYLWLYFHVLNEISLKRPMWKALVVGKPHFSQFVSFQWNKIGSKSPVWGLSIKKMRSNWFFYRSADILLDGVIWSSLMVQFLAFLAEMTTLTFTVPSKLAFPSLVKIYKEWMINSFLNKWSTLNSAAAIIQKLSKKIHEAYTSCLLYLMSKKRRILEFEIQEESERRVLEQDEYSRDASSSWSLFKNFVENL